MATSFEENIDHRGKTYNITGFVETMNAGRANQLLGTSIGNRATSNAQLARFTEAMLAGQWVTIFDPIRISNTGKLLDGHHRLEAIINSDSESMVLVLSGFPESIFEYMDQGQPRSLKDTFKLAERANPDKLASAAKFLFNMLSQKTDYIDAIKPSNQVGMQILRAHNDLEHSVVTALSICGPNGIQAPLAPVAVFHYLLAAKYGNRDIWVNDFFDTLVNAPANAGTAAVALRNKLQREWTTGRTKSGSRITWNNVEVLSWFTQAWMKHIENETVTNFQSYRTQPKYVSYVLELAKSIDSGLADGYHNFLRHSNRAA